MTFQRLNMGTLPEVVCVHPAEGGGHHGHGLLHRQLGVLVLAHDGVEEGLEYVNVSKHYRAGQKSGP